MLGPLDAGPPYWPLRNMETNRAGVAKGWHQTKLVTRRTPPPIIADNSSGRFDAILSECVSHTGTEGGAFCSRGLSLAVAHLSQLRSRLICAACLFSGASHFKSFTFRRTCVIFLTFRARWRSRSYCRPSEGSEEISQLDFVIPPYQHHGIQVQRVGQ